MNYPLRFALIALLASSTLASASIPQRFDALDGLDAVRPITTAANLTNLVDGVGTNRAGCDALNRLAFWRDAFGQTVSNVFDKAGNRVSLVYPDGKTVQYRFDAENRVTNVVDWAGRAWSFSFDAGDRLSGATYPNGITVTYGYDANNRLASYAYAKNGTNRIARTLTRNALGFKTVETISAGLEPVPTDTWQKHRSDAADRVQHISRRDEYAMPERWRDVVSEYDPEGNPTNRPTSYRGLGSVDTLAWDYENRLTAFSGDLSTNLWLETPPVPYQQPIMYQYDGLGRRVCRTDETGVTRRFVLDRVSRFANVLVESDGTNAAVRRYVWAGPVGLLALVDADGTVRYPLCDEQGSVLALTDAAGNVTDQFTYSPYGELWNRTGTNETAYTYLGSLGVRLEGGAMYFCNARYYDARQARFLNADPIGLAGGANLYMYAMGNPAVFVDPSGWCAESWSDRANVWLSDTVDSLSEPFENAARWTRRMQYGLFDVQPMGNQQAEWRAVLPSPQQREQERDRFLTEMALAMSLHLPAGARSGDTIAEGMRISPYRVTGPGETFIRYESANPAFSKITPSGGVKPGTFAAPASDGLLPVGQRASTYNLPNPEIPRPNATTLTPPAGTPIIGPRPVSGGPGNEVVFWMGY